MNIYLSLGMLEWRWDAWEWVPCFNVNVEILQLIIRYIFKYSQLECFSVLDKRLEKRREEGKGKDGKSESG